MSTFIQKLIPVDIEVEIKEEGLVKIVEFLKNEYKNVNIEYVKYGELAFIDCGSNLSAIYCNCCNRLIDFEWWSEQMNNWYGSKNIFLNTQCCNSLTNLNDLIYDMECGFSLFKGLRKILNQPPTETLSLIDLFFCEVKYQKADNKTSYVEFYDENGELVATYSNNGWTSYTTKAENARNGEFLSLYNEAYYTQRDEIK